MTGTTLIKFTDPEDKENGVRQMFAFAADDYEAKTGKKATTATGTILEGNIIKLAGFDIVECPHITRGGDDNTNTIGGVGHVFPAEYKNKKPIIIHHKSAVGVVKLKDVNVEHARRAEYQADQFITKMAEGCGGLRPEACFIGVIESA